MVSKQRYQVMTDRQNEQLDMAKSIARANLDNTRSNSKVQVRFKIRSFYWRHLSENFTI